MNTTELYIENIKTALLLLADRLKEYDDQLKSSALFNLTDSTNE